MSSLLLLSFDLFYFIFGGHRRGNWECHVLSSQVDREAKGLEIELLIAESDGAKSAEGAAAELARSPRLTNTAPCVLLMVTGG